MKCFTKISFYSFLNRVKFSYLVLFTCLLFVGAFIMQSCEESITINPRGENILNPSSENGKLIVSINSDEEYFADMDFGNSKFSYFTQTNVLKSSNGSSNALQSNFQIKKGNTIVYSVDFELDTTIADYRLLQHKKIEEIAKSLNSNFTENDYDYVLANMTTFIKEIKKSNSFNKTNLQSILFHKAIVNAKKREKQTGVLECVPYPFYITGKSYYTDIKDVSYSMQTMQSVIESHPKMKGVPELKAFLNNYKGDKIPFDQIYYLSVDKQRYMQFLDNAPNKTETGLRLKSSRIFLNKQGVQVSEGECDCAWWCPLGCGCSWGCCGNYEGCCLYWNILCFGHDWECTCCNSELVPCGPDCVRDPGCGSW